MTSLATRGSLLGGTIARRSCVVQIGLACLLSWLIVPSAQAAFMMSVAPLQAICREIVVKSEDCALLLAPGVSPHTYEPRPNDLRALSRARSLFFVSPLLDEWAIKLPLSNKVQVIDWLPEALRLPIEHDDHGHEHGHKNVHQDKAAVDPHFWLDPLAVKAILPRFVQALCQLEATSCASFQKNADRFAASLDALHLELNKTLEPIRSQGFLVYHPFLGYFVRRYQLKIVGTVEPAPGKEPTARYLKAMIDRVKQTKAKAVIVSPEVKSGPAHAVAEAAGIKLVVVDDLGGTAGRERYADLLRANAKTLVEALK